MFCLIPMCSFNVDILHSGTFVNLPDNNKEVKISCLDVILIFLPGTAEMPRPSGRACKAD